MIADGLATANPYTRPNANPTGDAHDRGAISPDPARRGQAMPDPLPIHLGDTRFPAAGTGMVSVTIGHS